MKSVEVETTSNAPNASSDAERGRFNAIDASEKHSPLSKAATSENEDFDSDEGSIGRPRSVPSTTISPHPTLTPDKISRLPQTIVKDLGQRFKMPLLAVTKPSGQNVKASAQKTSRGMLFSYDTKTGGFSGGGFTYDHFGTSKIETVDLSGRSRLVFGLKGDPSEVKLEIVDSKGRKASVILEGIKRGKEQVWAIPTSEFKGVNLERVRIIFFIVEGNRQVGKLTVNRIPAN
ncbi:MAG: hypothetical protein HYU34_01895 [Candidatus Omnitrophica bacterium]|nr:hypothetical protein [Candidatus Omnitrophota bacterium]